MKAHELTAVPAGFKITQSRARIAYGAYKPRIVGVKGAASTSRISAAADRRNIRGYAATARLNVTT